MKVYPLPAAKVKQYFVDMKNFNGGTMTNGSEAETNPKYAIQSNNLIQGLLTGKWKTRPGTNYYGTAITGVSTIDGGIEYEKDNGDGTFTRYAIVIGGGKMWKSEDGGAWTEVTGATFTSGYKPYFLQTDKKLFVSNRHDPFAYFDGTNLNVYTAISTPSAPSGMTRTTLTTGSFNNYYRVVIVNAIGFTDPSASLSAPTNKHRDYWASGEAVNFNLPAIGTGTGFQIYWGEVDGEELKIVELPATATTFSDTGQTNYPINEYQETPDDNTTAAPKFGPMEMSGNRLWGTYDPDNHWRVYGSGTGTDFGRFSSFYGGFYIDLEYGGRYKPVSIVHYRTGKGDPIVTVLCQSPDGQGTIFQVELTSITIGSGATSTTFVVPVAYKIVGSTGADAPYSVIKAGNKIMFGNKKGAFFLQNQAQMFQVLDSPDSTAPIRNQWQAINQSKVGDIAGYFRPPVAYFSVAVGSDNDRTILFDFEKGNWNWAWTIGFKSFFEYTDSSSNTHFLGIPTSGNKLVEISDSYLGDFGVAFNQSYISPLIPVSDDKTDSAKVRYAIAEFGHLFGTVWFEVLGMSDDGTVSSIASDSADSTVGTSGIGDDEFSDFLFSDTEDVPTTFTTSSQKITLRVGSKIKAIQFKVYSNTLASWELLRIQAKGIIMSGRPKYN